MTNRKIPMITDLSEADRKSVEHQLKLLGEQMLLCEEYLRDYAAGGQNAYKFLVVMSWLHEDMEEAANELMKHHDLPGFFGDARRKKRAERIANNPSV
jgi:hypothetical protein